MGRKITEPNIKTGSDLNSKFYGKVKNYIFYKITLMPSLTL